MKNYVYRQWSHALSLRGRPNLGRVALIIIGLGIMGSVGCSSPDDERLVRQNNPDTVSSLQSARLHIQSQSSYGDTDNISYQGISYLIGSGSSPAAMQAIQQLKTNYPGGGQNFNVTFTGTFGKESGRFPNPSASFDVVHLVTLQPM